MHETFAKLYMCVKKGPLVSRESGEEEAGTQKAADGPIKCLFASFLPTQPLIVDR